MNSPEPETSPRVLDRIRGLLDAMHIPYRLISHSATTTSEESALVRGEDLHVGAKALLLKTDDVFRLFVLPADQKLDSHRVKRSLNAKKIRFASPEELMALTGLMPGSVPPFGHPILPMDLFADTRIGRQVNRVAFNAGSLTDSIVMSASDWRRAAQPSPLEIAQA